MPGTEYMSEHFLQLFRLCLDPGLDEDKLRKHGYTSYLNYTMGYKEDNFPAIGWGGQDNNFNPGMTNFIGT